MPGRQDGVPIVKHPPIIWTNVGAGAAILGTLDIGPPDAETILKTKALRVLQNQPRLESLLNLMKLKKQKRTRDTDRIG